MRDGWSGAALAIPRGAWWLALFVSSGAVVACGGSSKSKNTPSSAAGRGGGAGLGGSGTGGASGTSSAGTPGGGAFTGGAAGEDSGAAGGSEDGVSGFGGESSGGARAAGAAGDDASHAGEAAGGAGGGCQNWCTVDMPACCGAELRCVESAPSCRIDVLAENVDVIYEYAELQAEVNALSGAIAATIPLSEVEHAAADPAPAARFEMTLNADASADLAALAGMHLHPFRVSCDDEELFVGVVYMLGGAAAIRTPVLHAEAADSGALVLRLGAWQGAWIISGSDGDEALRERIDRAGLRVAFCERGALQELE